MSKHMAREVVKERIMTEMRFHLSIKNGLSEADDMELWSLSAGAARSLALCHGRVVAAVTDEMAMKSLRGCVVDYDKNVKEGHSPFVAQKSRYSGPFKKGGLYGMARAWQLATDDRAEPASGNPFTTSR